MSPASVHTTKGWLTITPDEAAVLRLGGTVFVTCRGCGTWQVVAPMPAGGGWLRPDGAFLAVGYVVPHQHMGSLACEAQLGLVYVEAEGAP